MANVFQHFNWILQSYQEVVHLIEVELVTDNMRKEYIGQHPIPVNEPASGRTSNIHLPVTHQAESLVKHQDLINLLRLKN